MDKKKALEKIKKCLALGKSANEHEAPQALKQAQALMRKYELDEHDVELSGIAKAGAERKVAYTMTDWQWGVGHLVAGVFGCGCYAQGKTMRFFGLGSRAELAAYAFDVVYRQINAARRKFLREEVKARLKKHRAYLADQYCEGWLDGASGAVREFAMAEKETALMKEYEDNLALREAKTRSVCAAGRLAEAGSEAAAMGWRDGKDVQLHHAMNGADGVRQIGGGS